jgi:hypothetical protein
MDATSLDRFKSKRRSAPTQATAAPTSTGEDKTAKRRKFQAQWARLPLSWLIALRQTKNASAKQLAMEILFAEFRREYTGGDEIVLSAATTKLPHPTRTIAIRELVRLGLIDVEQHGREAARVVRLNMD